MKTRNRRREGRGSLRLIEEAIHLLRMSSGPALACYYAGTLPFVLAALFFWADMSRSPFAEEHLTASSLGLALLFLWMKCWQAVFAGHVRAAVSASKPPRWTWRRCARLVMIQTALQPTAVIFLTLAAFIIFPVGWVYAFYQNVTALGGGEPPEAMAVLKKSWKQALLWPVQNHLMLGLLAGLGFFGFVNLCIVSFSLPTLLKTLLGIDSVYAHSTWSMLNTTFFATMFGLTFLCLDPVVKTVYALRCFYGEAITSGEDLKAELKQFNALPKLAGALVVLFAGLMFTQPLRAADAPPAPPPASAPGVDAPQLDRALDDVVHQSKYMWRMPRDPAKKDSNDNNDEGWLSKFFDQIGDMLKKWAEGIGNWLDRMMKKLFPTRGLPAKGGTSAIDWGAAIWHLAILLLILVAIGLSYLLFRVWQRAKYTPGPIISEAVPVTPDLADENVAADQLPEDGWTKLGREMLERGEFRLALRAFYFASLAHLAARGLITVAKFKSNRDYERELGRRGHSLPDLLATFGQNVLVFDRSWYGLHEVNGELVHEFLANVERIKGV